MNAIACGQYDVLGDGCPGCGGWLHRVQRGGFPGPNGWHYCDEDCIADHQEYVARQHVESHYGTRDLLCECEICTARGLPTQAMRDEYAAYLADLPAVEGGGPTP